MDFTPSPVSDHRLPAYIAVGVQQALTCTTAWAAGKGYIPPDLVGQIVAWGIVGISSIWGVYQQHKAEKRLNAAIAAPAGMKGDE